MKKSIEKVFRKASQALPKDKSKISIPQMFVWFLVTLAGTIASIILLLQLGGKQAKNPPPPSKPYQKWTENSIPVHVPVADDDPRIFSMRNFGCFAGFLITMIAFILVTGALLSGFYLPGRSIIITPAPTLLPPGPRLETVPGQGFQSLHATQEAELNSYGWVDRGKGVVHIPIDRAMQLLAQSKLPVATGTPVGITPPPP